MLKKSYDHPVLQSYRMDKVEKALGEHFHTERMHHADQTNVILVLAKDPNVKGFYHPIIKSEYSIVIDARSYAKLDRDGDSFTITNQSEYDFNVLRAQLELAWQHDGRFGMINLSSIPANFYTKWISEAITRTFNLTPENQMKVGLVSALYFYCQFRPEEEWDERSLPKVVSFVSRATGVQASMVETYLPKLDYIGNFAEFTQRLLDITHDGSLAGMNTRSLYTVLTTGWRGAHANEIAMLAVNYPPAFYAMVVSAAKDRSYRNTPIQKIIDRTKKNIDTDAFAKSVKMMLMAVREDWS